VNTSRAVALGVAAILSLLPACGGRIYLGSESSSDAPNGGTSGPTEPAVAGTGGPSSPTSGTGSNGACDGTCAGSCVGGRCLMTLVSGVLPLAMAIDSNNVYFTTANSVEKVPTKGGPSTTLASSAVLISEAPTGPIGIDAAYVYWAAVGIDLAEVFKVGLNGGDAQEVAGQLPSGPVLIAVDAMHLYTAEPSAIISDPLSGSTVVGIAYGMIEPSCIAIDEANVYWASTAGNVMKASSSRSNSKEITLASGQMVTQGIAVDATSVYWTSRSGGTVMKVAIDGGAPVTLASGQNLPHGIAVDATSVYWANQGLENQLDGTIMKVSLRGGTPATLASDQAAPSAIAVDGESVYWIATGGSGGVMKLTPK
jgi:hypothetical protein